MLIAGSSGIMEVDMGKLALEKSSRKDVKDFAAMMVKEHTDINTEYARLLAKNCFTPPNTMFPDNQHLYDSLKALPPSAFDSSYINMMISDHGKAINLFDVAYQNAREGEIKTWLARMKDVVKRHYDMTVALKGPAN
jgi:putative membrane protein